MFGPEVLAYGENMGESYLSDATLAFIEDMGFYIANYSAAGRFGDSEIIDIEIQDSSILQVCVCVRARACVRVYVCRPQ